MEKAKRDEILDFCFKNRELNVEDTGEMVGIVLEVAYNNFSDRAIAKNMAQYLVSHTHRTIQQSIVNAVIILLEEIGKQEYYDDRNRLAVEAAKVATEALKEKDLDRLPMI
jgi:hypothetical protein